MTNQFAADHDLRLHLVMFMITKNTHMNDLCFFVFLFLHSRPSSWNEYSQIQIMHSSMKATFVCINKNNLTLNKMYQTNRFKFVYLFFMHPNHLQFYYFFRQSFREIKKKKKHLFLSTSRLFIYLVFYLRCPHHWRHFSINLW